MSDQITDAEFIAAGLPDWTVRDGIATADFSTGDFRMGLALVNMIGGLAEAADHHPDIDLRYQSVTVRLCSRDVASLSQRDLSLAEKISGAAAGLRQDY